MRAFFVLILALFVTTASPARAVERYVSLNGSDTNNDCAAPGTPCRTVARAVDQSTAGDEIRIATGAYTEELVVDFDLTVRGGYTPDFTSVLDDTPEQTILDGQASDRVLTVDGNGASVRVTIENLQIQNGLAQTASPLARFGGGILVTESAVLEATDVIVTDCAASSGSGTGFGGGIAVIDAEAIVSSSEISACEANTGSGVGQGRGGGIYVAGRFGAGDALLTLTDSVIAVNYAQGSTSSAGSGGNDGYGGGLFVGAADDARVTLRDNVWNANAARKTGTPADVAFGGAIYAQGGSPAVVVDVVGDQFILNRASNSVGATNTSGAARGGAVCLDADEEGTLVATLAGTEFVFNRVADDVDGLPVAQGGALFTRFADVTVTDASFRSNVALRSDRSGARGQGGAIYQNDGLLVVERTEFVTNLALEGNGDTGIGTDSQGGAVASNGPGRLEMRSCFLIDNRVSQTVGNGEGVHLGSDATALLQHLTIAGSEPRDGAAVFVRPTGNATTDVVVQNSIFAEYGYGIFNTSTTDIVQMQNSLFEVAAPTFGQVLDTGTSPFLLAAPQFVDVAGGDYRLAVNSPAIDGGLATNVDTDFDGEARPMGDAPDIGADEFFVDPVTSVIGSAARAAHRITIAPNPFNPSTEVMFEIARPGRVQLDVFDARGRRVVSLLDEVRGAGEHRIRWDGRSDAGEAVASGQYYARLVHDGATVTTKMTLAK